MSKLRLYSCFNVKINRYLNDGWCNAIYHDRFEELCKEIREITINPVLFNDQF